MQDTPVPGQLSNRSFALFALSSFVSLLGDQLTLIALPWLMLSLTNDAVAVGTMFALLGIPRALVILLGGALADRFHPARLLAATRLMSLAALALLAALASQHRLQPAHLYLFALGLGVCGAVAIPASSSLLPRLLSPQRLGSGNAMFMGMNQLAALLGPVISGAILQLYHRRDLADTGFATVFALDAASFAVGAAAMAIVAAKAGASPAARAGLRASLADGWRHVRSDKALSTFLFYIGLISLFTTGPMMVGVPMLVRDELHGGALEYGTFLVFMNLGGLLSMALVPMVGTLPGRLFVPVILGLDIVVGLLMIVFVNQHVAGVHQAILLLVGIIGGYVQVALITRIQKRVDRRYLGRVMSYVMFAYIGLVPVSATVAGFVVRYTSAREMFVGVGIAIATIALVFLFNRRMRTLADEPQPQPQTPAGVELQPAR